MTAIHEEAFRGWSSLSSIVLPEGLTIRSEGFAFYYDCTTLSSISFPESVSFVSHS